MGYTFFKGIIMYSKLSGGRDFSSVLSLESAKHQLNLIGIDHDDNYVTAIIPVAIDITENETNNLLADATVTCSFNIERDGNSQFLPKIPLPVTLTSVQIGGEDVDYSYNSISGVVTVHNQTSGDVVVVYDVNASFTTETAKHAVKIILTDLYENRGSRTDEQTYSAPLAFKSLCKSIKWRGV